jgi:hypothetical protein
MQKEGYRITICKVCRFCVLRDRGLLLSAAPCLCQFLYCAEHDAPEYHILLLVQYLYYCTTQVSD